MSWRFIQQAVRLAPRMVRRAGPLLFLGGCLMVLLQPLPAGEDLPAPSPLPPEFLWGAHEVRVAFSPVGRTLAIAGRLSFNQSHTGLILWDLDSDCKKVIVHKNLDKVNAFAFSPDGKRFAIGYGGSAETKGVVMLWETSSCKKLADLGTHDGAVRSAAFSPDGSLLATSGGACELILWDVPKREKRFALAIHTDWVKAVAFSPDGKILASASHDGTICLTDVDTGRVVRILSDGQKNCFLESVAFSPDGRSLASSGAKGVQLWEAATRKRRAVFDRYEGTVISVAFSPDGRLLAGGSSNHELKVWDLRTGKERFSQKCESDVTSLSFSPNSRILAGSLGSDQVKLWDVSGLLLQGPLPPPHLSSAELEALWADLAGEDAAKAYRAIQTLLRAGKRAQTFLGDRLKPASPADSECLARLIKELDSDSFTVREKAEAELQKLEGLAEPALRQALQGKPSPEVRQRLESLLQKLDGPVSVPETLRGLRTVEVLEYLGTPEARRILERLAEGATEARLTWETKASLERLTKRTAVAP